MSENFDEKAKTWDNDPGKIQRAQSVARSLLKAIPIKSSMTALEYGCGTGLLSFELLPHLKHITLIDSSNGMIEVLKEKILSRNISNMSPVKADLISMKNFNDQFDLIYTLMALHHISDTKTILKRFHSLLNENNYLVIIDLDKEDGSFHKNGTDVHHGFDRIALKKILTDIGFHPIHDEICFHMRKTINGKEEIIFPIFLLACQKKII